MNVLVLYIGAIILFIWGIAQEVERANVKGQSPMVTIRPTLSTAEPGWRNLYRIGGAAALLQLAAVLTYAIATAILGPKPTSAVEFFAVQQRSALEAVLRSDFLLLFLIGGYLGTFPGLYMALRRVSPVGAFYATLFTLIAWGAVILPDAPASQFAVAATEDLANVDPAIRSLSAAFTGVEGPYADTPEVSQALFNVNAGLTREVSGEGAAFVVWPENEFADADDPLFAQQLGELARESGSYIVADMVWRAPEGMYDAAVMFGPDGREAGRRAKINVTSAEEAYGFVPGPETFPVFGTPYGKVGLGVCWDRHRLRIVRELARAGAQIVLMPVDDDFRNRWFPAHHAADSVFRAVENRVAFVTGSTSGLSQVIDPYGRIITESDLYRRSAITGQVFTVQERAPYTRFGDWFGWLMVIGLAALVWRASTHPATAGPPSHGNDSDDPPRSAPGWTPPMA
jgi:hypothetical protein